MYDRIIKYKLALEHHQSLYDFFQKLYHIHMRMIRLGGYKFRHYMVLPEKELVYLVNYKAASSSILASMVDQDIEDEALIHKMARQRFTERTSLRGEEKGYYSFTFVRNPFTRLLSCYKDKVEGERGKERPYFRQNLFGRLADIQSFEAFALAVEKIPDRIADVHFVSQCYTILENEKPVVDFVGKMESLGDAYQTIQTKFKLDPIERFNRTSSDRWMDSYSPASAEAVYRRYQKDIEFFGYKGEYERLINYLESKRGS